MTLRLRPCSQREARAWVGAVHRHNLPPRGALTQVAVVDEHDVWHGVGILGRPTGRGLQDGYTAEITRVATDGTRNACSMLYGALARVAAGLGYRRVVTYTLETEFGASLRAAGFVVDAVLPAREDNYESATRARQADLWGNHARPDGGRTRWVRVLAVD